MRVSFWSRFTAFALIQTLLILVHTTNAQESIKASKFTIGEIVEYQSLVLNETRLLNVYLPASYSTNNDTKYPVIYLLDGSAEEDFIHVAGIVQFGSFTWIKMLPESIVVGIANVDRKRDFTTPAIDERDRKQFPTAGGAEKFIEMLRQEIQPLIEKRYRTQETKTLIGQSLGGLLATHILFNSPGLFNNYIIVSPSLWWNDGALLRSKPKELLPNTSIFIGVGKEGEIMEQAAKQLRDKIKNDKASHGRLFYQFFPELDHGDTLHKAVYKAFEDIFGRQ